MKRDLNQWMQDSKSCALPLVYTRRCALFNYLDVCIEKPASAGDSVKPKF